MKKWDFRQKTKIENGINAMTTTTTKRTQEAPNCRKLGQEIQKFPIHKMGRWMMQIDCRAMHLSVARRWLCAYDRCSACVCVLVCLCPKIKIETNVEEEKTKTQQMKMRKMNVQSVVRCRKPFNQLSSSVSGIWTLSIVRYLFSLWTIDQQQYAIGFVRWKNENKMENNCQKCEFNRERRPSPLCVLLCTVYSQANERLRARALSRDPEHVVVIPLHRSLSSSSSSACRNIDDRYVEFVVCY